MPGALRFRLPRLSGQVRPDAPDLSQDPAAGTVQPDASERFALAAFAGSPESRLRAEHATAASVFPLVREIRIDILFSAR